MKAVAGAFLEHARGDGPFLFTNTCDSATADNTVQNTARFEVDDNIIDFSKFLVVRAEHLFAHEFVCPFELPYSLLVLDAAARVRNGSIAALPPSSLTALICPNRRQYR